MKAPTIYVVVRRGEFSPEVVGWSFDKRDAEDEAERLTQSTGTYHSAEDVDPLGGEDAKARCEVCRWR